MSGFKRTDREERADFVERFLRNWGVVAGRFYREKGNRNNLFTYLLTTFDIVRSLFIFESTIIISNSISKC